MSSERGLSNGGHLRITEQQPTNRGCLYEFYGEFYGGFYGEFDGRFYSEFYGGFYGVYLQSVGLSLKLFT